MSSRSNARRARPKRRRLTTFGALGAATAVGLAGAPAAGAAEPVQTGSGDALASLRAPGQISSQLLAGTSLTASSARAAGITPLRNSETLYTVRAGDTVSHLALRYGTTVSRIVSQNNLDSSARIRVGQVLRIGGQDSSSAGAGSASTSSSSSRSATTHTVSAGDPVWALARQYNTTVGAIISANDLGSNALIRIGQRLTIPGSSSSGGSSGGSSSSGSSSSGSSSSGSSSSGGSSS